MLLCYQKSLRMLFTPFFIASITINIFLQAYANKLSYFVYKRNISNIKNQLKISDPSHQFSTCNMYSGPKPNQICLKIYTKQQSVSY